MIFALLVGTAANAHQTFVPTGSNRYLKLTLLGGGALRIAYTVMVGQMPALAARRAADLSHDGVIDADEQAAVGRALRDEVTRGLTIEIDGVRRVPAWETPVTDFTSDTHVGALPFSVDLVGRLEPGGGAHLVRIDDDTPIEQLNESELRVEEGPGTQLVAGWQGAEDAGRQMRWLFQGPKRSAIEDRSIGLRYVDGARRARSRPLPLALGGALLGAALASYVMWRRKLRKGTR
jgi:hypothetical protein